MLEGDHDFIGEEAREENGDEGDEMVWDKNFKGNTKYKDFVQSPEGGDIGG